MLLKLESLRICFPYGITSNYPLIKQVWNRSGPMTTWFGRYLSQTLKLRSGSSIWISYQIKSCRLERFSQYYGGSLLVPSNWSFSPSSSFTTRIFLVKTWGSDPGRVPVDACFARWRRKQISTCSSILESLNKFGMILHHFFPFSSLNSLMLMQPFPGGVDRMLTNAQSSPQQSGASGNGEI